jgi:hypothetical protein
MEAAPFTVIPVGVQDLRRSCAYLGIGKCMAVKLHLFLLTSDSSSSMD